jgi:hypothetical protein
LTPRGEVGDCGANELPEGSFVDFLSFVRSMARRVFPSKLEWKSFFGSFRDAPRSKVSFTTCC